MKKIVSLMMSFALVLVSVLPAGAASFSDVSENNENYRAIEYLRSGGYVKGYGDGEFRPNSTVNRAEFIKILLEGAGYDEDDKLKDCFSDVSNQWFASYVCKAKEEGIVSGYPDGSFRPGTQIAFTEAAKMIVNTLGVSKEETDTEIWYKPFVMALENVNAIPGGVTTFGKNVTRGEAAEMVWRVMTNNRTEVSNTYNNIVMGKTAEDEELPAKDLVSFSSCSELKEAIEKNSSYNDYSRGWEGDLVFEEAMDDAQMAMPTAGATNESKSASDGGSADYSETNIQVEGVDEADIVKTDGKYIYLIKDDTVRVVYAYPPGDMYETDSVTFGDDSFRPMEMYVSDYKLVVIGTSYHWSVNEEEEEELDTTIIDSAEEDKEKIAYPGGYGSVGTKVFVFSVKDPENIKKEREVMIEGSYMSSRRIDGMVYLATTTYRYNIMPYYRGGILEDDELADGDSEEDEVVVPNYIDTAEGEETKAVCGCTDVLYPPYLPPENYLTLAAIPTDDLSEKITKQVVLGSGNTVYASKENFYIASPYYRSFMWTSSDETIIHKFKLDSDLTYVGNASVPGSILNQFSMDEYDGNLRIATTSDSWSGGSKNNIYVLDEDLERIGGLTGLAEGERIYSVRFMGKRAYMVTFVRIDPLFVIDLSDPTNPEVLGELKIPGVSDYLHPYDENHLIGFGLDTANEEEMEEAGWVWFQGIKISMFDVTDVANPVELHKTIIGDRGSETPLRYNHKALFFDKERNLMALPVLVREIPEELKEDPDTEAWEYGDTVFQGAYVYEVSVDGGFKLRGKISHFSDTTFEELGGNYWGGPRDIERILRIGDYLYSISKEIVGSFRISDLSEVERVKLRIKE